MSVATELQRIIDAKTDLKTAIEAKGVTVSSDALIDDYADYVDSIPTGGAAEEKLLNFIDFNGTIVASYDGSEIAGLSSLPSAPDHSTDEVPLTTETWNWTLAEIKSYHTSYPQAQIWVGMTYHTTDGLVHMIINTEESNYTIQFSGNNSFSGTMNWGDGTTESVSGSSVSHTYSNAGRYNISFNYNGELNISSNTNPSIASCLTELYVSQSLKTLPNCSGSLVKTIVLSNNEFRLGNGTTNNLPQLECLIVPVIYYAFNRNIYCSNNYSQKYLSIPLDSSITIIDISECRRLRGITLPEPSSSQGISSISSSDINNLVIPENYKLDSSGRFKGACFNNVYLPSTWVTTSNLNNLGVNNNNCMILEGIHFANNFPSYFACGYVGGLKTLSIPEGIETINLNYFSISSINLPSTLTTIEKIGNTALKQITIPSGVTTIGSSAFSGNYSLTSVVMLPTTPPTLGSSAFATYVQKIYVPYSADHSVLDAYKAATNWSNYASKMEELPE